MRPLLALVRPRHWIKNLLIFSPLIFAEHSSQLNIEKSIYAFFSFSFVASAIYILNDIADAEADSHHPQKKKRPIASGEISKKQATFLGATLIIFSFILSSLLPQGFVLSLSFYALMNVAYSYGLKKVLIVDVMIIAIGFVLRVIAGAFAIDVLTSPWIILCTFFVSLFLGFGKRKSETEVLQEASHRHRKVLTHYTTDFLNQLIGITAAMTIITYSLYTIDEHTVARFGTEDLIYTVPLVVFGLFRYFHLLYNKSTYGDPTQVFSRDKGMILTVILWLLLFLSIAKIG